MSTGVRAGGDGFRPPPYPYDRLEQLRSVADRHPGGCVDLSVGTPTDPPPPAVAEALASSGAEVTYPRSVGSPELLEAACAWMQRELGVRAPPDAVGACVGTKELVVGLPHLLRLRDPSRDTVLYPAVSYPSYAMGATLAGCRVVPVALDERWRLDLDSIDGEDAARAVCLWVNTPGNPAGGLDDLAAAAAWGRRHGVPVLSDECYVEFTWEGSRRTILAAGPEGVLAVHSLSKRSNMAGLRVGFYAGDPELVHYLRETRKHAGLMVPGPSQAAAVAALSDQHWVEEQRERYAARLAAMQRVLAATGLTVELPGGGFYLWVAAPDGDDWGLARWLAHEGGVLVSPGEFYGAAGTGHVRVALVRPFEELELVGQRLAGARIDATGHATRPE